LNKNTLYITFDGLSDPLGQSQILPYLCGLAKNGYHISILSCEKKERLDAEINSIHEQLIDLPISWKYILYDEEGGFLSRIRYIRSLKKMAEEMRAKKPISLIHCRSYLSSLIGLSFKLKYNIPFIFDMRGFWADERMDGGIWKRSNPLQNLFYRYFKTKEKQFLKECDAIVSLTQAAVKELSKNYGASLIEKKTTIIPCCTNTSLFDRAKTHSNNLLPQLSKNDHVLIYTGSIGTWYYTREIIDCVLVWRSKIPDLKLVILTKDRIELELILADLDPEQQKIILVASASYQDVAKYLALAKAAIFFIKPAYSKIASSPTKMAECWAMDLPIITNKGIGDNDLYFKNYKGGVLINAFTHQNYLEACSDYLKLQANPGFYRKLALEHFDTELAIQRYCEIYNKCSI
jgi:glycosyltransferase involved in cell wall biosynthesis